MDNPEERKKTKLVKKVSFAEETLIHESESEDSDEFSEQSYQIEDQIDQNSTDTCDSDQMDSPTGDFAFPGSSPEGTNDNATVGLPVGTQQTSNNNVSSGEPKTDSGDSKEYVDNACVDSPPEPSEVASVSTADVTNGNNVCDNGDRPTEGQGQKDPMLESVSDMEASYEASRDEVSAMDISFISESNEAEQGDDVTPHVMSSEIDDVGTDNVVVVGESDSMDKTDIAKESDTAVDTESAETQIAAEASETPSVASGPVVAVERKEPSDSAETGTDPSSTEVPVADDNVIPVGNGNLGDTLILGSQSDIVAGELNVKPAENVTNVDNIEHSETVAVGVVRESDSAEPDQAGVDNSIDRVAVADDKDSTEREENSLLEKSEEGTDTPSNEPNNTGVDEQQIGESVADTQETEQSDELGPPVSEVVGNEGEIEANDSLEAEIGDSADESDAIVVDSTAVESEVSVEAETICNAESGPPCETEEGGIVGNGVVSEPPEVPATEPESDIAVGVNGPVEVNDVHEPESSDIVDVSENAQDTLADATPPEIDNGPVDTSDDLEVAAAVVEESPQETDANGFPDAGIDEAISEDDNQDEAAAAALPVAAPVAPVCEMDEQAETVPGDEKESEDEGIDSVHDSMEQNVAEVVDVAPIEDIDGSNDVRSCEQEIQPCSDESISAPITEMDDSINDGIGKESIAEESKEPDESHADVAMGEGDVSGQEVQVTMISDQQSAPTAELETDNVSKSVTIVESVTVTTVVSSTEDIEQSGAADGVTSGKIESEQETAPESENADDTFADKSAVDRVDEVGDVCVMVTRSEHVETEESAPAAESESSDKIPDKADIDSDVELTNTDTLAGHDEKSDLEREVVEEESKVAVFDETDAVYVKTESIPEPAGESGISGTDGPIASDIVSGVDEVRDATAEEPVADHGDQGDGYVPPVESTLERAAEEESVDDVAESVLSSYPVTSDMAAYGTDGNTGDEIAELMDSDENVKDVSEHDGVESPAATPEPVTVDEASPEADDTSGNQVVENDTAQEVSMDSETAPELDASVDKVAERELDGAEPDSGVDEPTPAPGEKVEAAEMDTEVSSHTTDVTDTQDMSQQEERQEKIDEDASRVSVDEELKESVVITEVTTVTSQEMVQTTPSAEPCGAVEKVESVPDEGAADEGKPPPDEAGEDEITEDRTPIGSPVKDASAAELEVAPYAGDALGQDDALTPTNEKHEASRDTHVWHGNPQQGPGPCHSTLSDNVDKTIIDRAEHHGDLSDEDSNDGFFGTAGSARSRFDDTSAVLFAQVNNEYVCPENEPKISDDAILEDGHVPREQTTVGEPEPCFVEEGIEREEAPKVEEAPSLVSEEIVVKGTVPVVHEPEPVKGADDADELHKLTIEIARGAEFETGNKLFDSSPLSELEEEDLQLLARASNRESFVEEVGGSIVSEDVPSKAADVLNATEDTSTNGTKSEEEPGVDLSEAVGLEYFTGGSSWNEYYQHFEAFCRSKSWIKPVKASYLFAHLKGRAKQVACKLSPEQQRDYDRLIATLGRFFTARDEAELYLFELRNRARKPKESLRDLGADVKRLTDMAYPEIPQNQRVPLARIHFLDALKDSGMLKFIYMGRPNTIDQAIQLGIDFEGFKRVGATEAVKIPSPVRVEEIVNENDKSAMEKRMEELAKSIGEIKSTLVNSDKSATARDIS